MTQMSDYQHPLEAVVFAALTQLFQSCLDQAGAAATAKAIPMPDSPDIKLLLVSHDGIHHSEVVLPSSPDLAVNAESMAAFDATLDLFLKKMGIFVSPAEDTAEAMSELGDLMTKHCYDAVTERLAELGIVTPITAQVKVSAKVVVQLHLCATDLGEEVKTLTTLSPERESTVVMVKAFRAATEEFVDKVLTHY